MSEKVSTRITVVVIALILAAVVISAVARAGQKPAARPAIELTPSSVAMFRCRIPAPPTRSGSWSARIADRIRVTASIGPSPRQRSSGAWIRWAR
jgi:hypothetical protein